MTSVSLTRAPALLSALALAGLALPASAQIAPAPGAPLAGVCVYSQNLLLGQSLAGVAANQKLTQLQQSVNTDLKTTRDKLIADSQAAAAQKASLPAAQYQQKAEEMQRRARDLDSLVRTRESQLTRTRDDVVGRISTAALPLLNASLTAHRCAIVLDRGAAYSVNPAMDLTGEVTQKLNAALPTIDVQLAAPQAPAAR